MTTIQWLVCVCGAAAVGLFYLGYKLGEKSSDELRAIHKNVADKCLELTEKWEKLACNMENEWGASIDLNHDMLKYIHEHDHGAELAENKRRAEAFRAALENRKEYLKGTNGDLGGAMSGTLLLFEEIYEKGDFTNI